MIIHLDRLWDSNFFLSQSSAQTDVDNI